ncbi:tetratricopeptide repeat protein [Salaquimonas pukyongi]|uniref:tetratricopeptide repeat protein n=1 Tax=Salaquimonas pukyongi TaxID=2712698 RepID=UPI001FCDCC8E|nr:tetratricopeptide repeat protein [Salaquimonas pukyongi]
MAASFQPAEALMRGYHPEAGDLPAVPAAMFSRSQQEQDTLNELFGILARESDPKKAQRTSRQIVQKLTDSGSDSINLLMERALEAMRKNEHGVALDILDQVITLAPDYAEGWNRRATLYFAMKDFSRSIADVERVLELEPRHYGALSGLAAMLQSLGREKRALEIWYKVLEIYPANEQAQSAVITLEEKLAGSPT